MTLQNAAKDRDLIEIRALLLQVGIAADRTILVIAVAIAFVIVIVFDYGLHQPIRSWCVLLRLFSAQRTDSSAFKRFCSLRS